MKLSQNFRNAFWIGVLFLPVLAMVLIPTVIIWMQATSGPRRDREVDPPADFEQFTGLPWPDDANVVIAHDTHLDFNSGGFGFGPGLLDGELYIAFETHPEVIREWLASPAPWGEDWQTGDIPADALTRTSLPEEINEHDVSYALRHDCCPDDGLPYNDASLLVLDPQEGRVWLCHWNH